MINFDILEKIREAQRLAEIEQIKANSIVINKNFVKTPKLYFHNKGTVSILPPMICGLEMYFTDNDLPENYSFAILEAGQTERDRLISDTRYETAKEIYEWIEKHSFFNGFELIENYLKERYGVEVE